ncbi:MAG: accessory factor UbiK family protein [Zoogloeaceae bacterium]|jgi:BMFP domain-containing protein YqiC|nr:accessory factor UbiK family protein [Zoogloeaceae bacterium]
MFQSSAFSDFLDKINNMMVSNPVADMEKNARAMMSGFFSNIDLVTREEYEAQTAVLNSTRQRLHALERRLQALEAAMRESASQTA